MPDADSATFRMVGAREVLLLLPGTAHIERLVVALEGAVNSNPALAFDLSKSLIESVCKTLLQDRGKDVGDDLESPSSSVRPWRTFGYYQRRIRARQKLGTA